MTGPSRPDGRGTSARKVERILGRTLVMARAGALVLLAAIAVPGLLRGSLSAGTVTGDVELVSVAAAAAAESVVLALAVLISSRWSRWVVLDTLCLMAVLAAPAWSIAGWPPTQSPFAMYVLVAVAGVGLADWPIVVALGAALAVGAANMTVALIPGSTYPLANAIPDSLCPAAVVLVVWLIARSRRVWASALDRHRLDAVCRSEQIAAERERVRQQRLLTGDLMATVAALAADHAVADPHLRAQIRSEAWWLDMAVRDGQPENPSELLDALRQLISEQAGLGMSVTLSVPADAPQPAPAAVAAVVEASRQALTNIQKRAGRAAAAIQVSADETGGVVVEIRYAGRGFSATRAGPGHPVSIRQRLLDVGGRAVIDSRRGSGTVVRLWVPDRAARGGVGWPS